MEWPARGAEKSRRSTMKKASRARLSCLGDVSFRLRLPLCGQFQPVTLVHKGNAQQQDSQSNKAQDAILTFELGEVVDENFDDGRRNQDKGLPPHESAAAKEPDNH